jgi:hypothetical protein
MREPDVPVKYREMYQRAMTGRAREASVRTFCLMCVGWLYKEVQACTDPRCPLYPYRLPSRLSAGGAALNGESRAGREDEGLDTPEIESGATEAVSAASRMKQ